jgi:hypothetical protein
MRAHFGELAETAGSRVGPGSVGTTLIAGIATPGGPL